MLKLLCAALLALAVSACANMGALDTKIATGSAALTQQCGSLQVAISTAQAFARKPRVKQALDAAERARAAFCAHPPANTQEAVLTIGSIILSVQSALKA